MKIYTNIVHDVIGDEPVLDQFDLGYPASFYGSTQDAYITGTLLTVNKSLTAANKQVTFTIGDRGKLFNKLDADTQPALDSTYGSAEVAKNSSYAERLIPWLEKTSNAYRILQAFDEKERFYDTCLPSIKECFEIDGTPFWQTHDNPKYWLSPYGNVKTDGIGYLLFNANPITNNKKLTNNSWTWSFPFDESYKNVKRLISKNDAISDLSFFTTTNWYPKSFTKVKEKKFSSISVRSFFPLLPGKQQVDTSDFSFTLNSTAIANSLGSYRILVPSDIDLGQQNPDTSQLMTGTLSNDDMIKFLYGFGDLNNITYTNYSLNEDEDDETILSSSYFTGFELQNWTYRPPRGTYDETILAESFNGAPIPESGSVTQFNAQFDQSTGPVIVRWIPASGNLGLNDGYNAEIDYYLKTDGTSSLFSTVEAPMGWPAAGAAPVTTGWKEYPWIMITKEGTITSELDEFGKTQAYNYVSQSTYYSYPEGGSSSKILTGSTAVYWHSGSNPSRNWVLGSFLSAAIGPGLYYDDNEVTASFVFKMPRPKIPGNKIISSQKVDITASYPWKIAYQRAVSSPKTDYFYSSFAGMPGFPSSLGTVDYLLDKLEGTDEVFPGTGNIEQTPQTLTDFTSSLFPPGEYQLKFNYVKTGLSGTTNGVDRAFIDNINIFTYDVGQLTGNFSADNRLGYSHYPEFRQVIRDTRTSPYFPGTGFKTKNSIYGRLTKLPDFTKNAVSTLSITPAFPQISLLSTKIKSQQDLPAISTKPLFKVNVINPVAVDAIKLKSATEFLRDVVGYLSSNSYGGYEFGISPIIRGWKYGLYNGFPVHSHATFRRNRYGQFRDMLEQRLFTKFIHVDTTNVKNATRGGDKTRLSRISSRLHLLSTDTKLQDGPVTVKFVRQEARVDSNGLGTIITSNIDPRQTNSQNLSTEAVSATPFFDGLSKNRKISLGSLLQEPVLVTAASPKFISAAGAALKRVLPPNNLTITTLTSANALSQVGSTNSTNNNNSFIDSILDDEEPDGIPDL